MTIILKDVVFHARHGLYAGEEKAGGRYLVQAKIEYRSPDQIVKSIEQTIDYEKVFLLIAERMRHPEALLESLAMDIARKILDNFSLAVKVCITIEKCNPPIEGMEGNVAVEYAAGRFHDFDNA